MSPPLFLHTSRGKGRRILADGKDDFFVGKGRKEGRKEGRKRKKGTLISWHQLVPARVYFTWVYFIWLDDEEGGGGPGVTALVKLSCLVRDHLSVDPLTGAAGPDNNFISVKAAANLARIVALRRLHSPSAPWISIPLSLPLCLFFFSLPSDTRLLDSFVFFGRMETDGYYESLVD